MDLLIYSAQSGLEVYVYNVCISIQYILDGKWYIILF